MTRPTRGDVHINTALTNVSVAFIQNQSQFVSDRVFPNLPVQKESGFIRSYDRGFFNRIQMRPRAPGTESAGGDYTTETTINYLTNVCAYHLNIAEQVRANADSEINFDREISAQLTLQALLYRENDWAENFFRSSIWTNDFEGWDGTGTQGSDQVRAWSDDNSDPIGNIRDALDTVHESTGFRPNTLVLGQRVHSALIDHPDIIDRIKYGQTAPGPAVVSDDNSELSSIFKIPRVFVMGGVQNTAVEGAANAHSFISGNNAMLCYSAPTAGLYTPTAGYTFSWTGFLGAGTQGQRIKTIPIDTREATRFEIQMSFDHKVIAADLGFFWENILNGVAGTG